MAKQGAPASKTQVAGNGNSVTTVRLEKDFADEFRDWILQLIGVTAAVIFGAWSVLSWEVAKQANVQSRQANVLAFAAFCGQVAPTDSIAQLCSSASGALQASVTAAAMALFALTTTTTSLTITSTAVLSTTQAGTTLSTGTFPASTSSATTFPSITPSPIPSSTGISTAEIVGIVFGVIAGLVAVLTAVPIFIRARRARRYNSAW